MNRHVSTSIKTNTLINLIGAVIPIIISFVTVPIYLHLVGAVRYGVLAIVWLLLGYFGVFDLGLGRATTNQIARMSKSSTKEAETLFWTTLLTNTVLGLIGGAILFLTGHWLLEGLFQMPPEMRSEALSVLPWLALAVPTLTTSSVLIGALEGREHFLTVNVLGVIGTLLFQTFPLLIAAIHGPELVWLVGSVVIIRFLNSAFMFMACIKKIPLKYLPSIDPSQINGLLRYGGWVTVTGFVGPILVSLDQFLIGIQAGVLAVTYYTVPYNLVTQLWILPSSLSRTLFPRLSGLEKEEAQIVSRDACLVLGAIMTPVIVTAIVMIRPFLILWLGSSIAVSAAPIGEILLLGVWLNSLARIPFSLIQASGRPDLTAKFHLLEVPPHLISLWFGIYFFGLEGAAWSWTLRVILDTILLFNASSMKMRLLAPLIPAFIIVIVSYIIALLFGTQVVWMLVLGIGLIIVSIFWAWQILIKEIKAFFQLLPKSFIKSLSRS